MKVKGDRIILKTPPKFCLKQISVTKLPTAITKVLTEPSYKKTAIALQDAIVRSGGVKKAADIIEQVISTGKPVLATK